MFSFFSSSKSNPTTPISRKKTISGSSFEGDYNNNQERPLSDQNQKQESWSKSKSTALSPTTSFSQLQSTPSFSSFSSPPPQHQQLPTSSSTNISVSNPNNGPVFAPRGSSHPSSMFNLPPKKVIKANKDYTACYVQELSFLKGDFFYVIGEKETNHYEVMNPAARTRGLVPKNCFDSLDKAANTSSTYNNNIENQQNNTHSMPPSPTDQYYNHDEDPLYDDQHSTRLSPVSPKSPISNSGKNDGIMEVTVPNVEMKADGQYWFAVDVKYHNNQRHVLQRTYNDFWALQVSLLNFFPNESGHHGRPRILPFMQPPKRNWTPAIFQLRRSDLEAYLSELIKLPKHILTSQTVTRFFIMKPGDVKTPLDIGFDMSGTLMDLITEYNEGGDIPVRISITLGGDHDFILNVPEDVHYGEMIQMVEDVLNDYVPGLAFRDEINELISLQGDDDLRLLLKTNRHNMNLYIFDPYQK